MFNLKFSSKAKTLLMLKQHLKTADIIPLFIFNAVDYKNKKEKILDEIQKTFKKNIIIRSSSSKEDTFETSNAGEFVSILDVDTNSRKDLDNGISKVIKSYKKITKFDEVLIQTMLNDVQMSGVIFTADLDSLSEYYIINYDESGKTDSVTSGKQNTLKIFTSYKNNHIFKNDKLKKVIITAKECQKLFKFKFLDIEFGFSNSKLYIFQVRPIVNQNIHNKQINLTKGLKKLYKKIDKLNAKHPNLLGKKTIFGIMPDWNPAEIIGVRPKKLSLSLYKELITDETWAYQRDNYGYRNLRSHPLLVSLLGVPFIDVRVSFNSFIPKTLDTQVAEKLVNYYLKKLEDNPSYHDKIEFEIIFSCYYFGIKNDLEHLKNYGFNNKEIISIENSLLSLTNNVIDFENGLYKKDIKKVDILKKKLSSILDSDLPIIDKTYWLIKDVKRYGTLPFAGIARAAFIGVTLLKSFVKEKIISIQEYNRFFSTLNTVSKELVNDRNKLGKTALLKKYGHLRPGTYDILSYRYDEAYELYFSSKFKNENYNCSFNLSLKQKNIIDKKIIDSGLKSNANNLMRFIKEAIEGREYAKFVFTKHVSQILVNVENIGKKLKINRNDLAHLDIQKIIGLYSNLDNQNVYQIFVSDINKNKNLFKHTCSVKLPSIITNPQDVYSFFSEENKPNFITLNTIKSEIITENNFSKYSLKNKIVCIKSADPGYDYLFSKKIAGLITCFGGANSHMAIRCAELRIPAVIGCGEYLFNKYLKARVIEINSENKYVRILS